MTVLQIVKALAGKEDINWGNSDTTFSRQTRTGATTSISFVDSKCIPANTLGGVIDEHLHTQNTDTGTTGSSFVINSGGSYAVLNTTGLTLNSSFTFPLTGSQALVGATDLAGTGAGAALGAKTVGVYDTAGNFAQTTVEGVLAELATDVNAKIDPYGYKRGFVPGYVSASAISLTVGMWHHAGTTDQLVYSTGSISYTLTSLSGTQLQYLYLSDSAIVSAGTQVITATQLSNSTTVPTWSNTKYGWYNGNDRCIGTFLIYTGNIYKFRVVSDNFYSYPNVVMDVFDSTCPTTGAEASLDFSDVVPTYATKIRVLANLATDQNSISFFLDSSSAVMTKATTSQASEGLTLEPYLDTDQTLYWSCEAADAGTIALIGYYMGDL